MKQVRGNRQRKGGSAGELEEFLEVKSVTDW